jgi:hypothetical protein
MADINDLMNFVNIITDERIVVGWAENVKNEHLMVLTCKRMEVFN